MKDIQDTQTDMAVMNGKTVSQVIPTLEADGAAHTLEKCARTD
ncbi:MAG: hypothetical protein ABJN24_05080 [Hyphomicrobiales bacterium]